MRDFEKLRIKTNCSSCANKCCSQPLDWVYLTEDEITVLEASSNIGQQHLTEIPKNEINGLEFTTLRLLCAFLNRDGGCDVYGARPLSCRLFRFYPDPLVTRVMFLPAGCGDLVVSAGDDDDTVWSAAEYAKALDRRFSTLWAEAGSRST